MARSNKTEFVILGLLSIEPMTGYDMKAFISRPLGYFWAVSYGQLYPTLKKLHAAGSITRKVKSARSKPDRHVYSLTSQGKRRLTDWLARSPEPEPIRNELLLKLYFGNLIPQSAHVEHLKAYLDEQEQRLKIFGGIEKNVLDPLKNDPSYPLWIATLRYGIHMARARIRWCKETLARFDDT